MALKKGLTFANIGYDFMYHLISGVNFSKNNEKVALSVNSYKDQATRNAFESTPAKKTVKIFKKSDFNQDIFNAFASECYRLLKMSKLDDENMETNEFVNAEDVLE